MTVVTPGGPCLTQTQIMRDEAQARFEAKREAKAGRTANPYSAASNLQQTQTTGVVGGVEKPDTSMLTDRGYGARNGGTLVDISV